MQLGQQFEVCCHALLTFRRVSAPVQKGGAEVDQVVEVKGHGGSQRGGLAECSPVWPG